MLRVRQSASLLSSLLCNAVVAEHRFCVATPELRDQVVAALTDLAICNDAYAAC